MPDNFRRLYLAWGVDPLLRAYRGLCLRPHARDGLLIAGDVAFTAGGGDLESLTDTYSIRIDIPCDFPRRLPRVHECGGRIPRNYHKLDDGALCLGSNVRLRMKLGARPTLLEFVNRCVVPYLYGYSDYRRHGRLPFGQLDHGDAGITTDLQLLLGVDNEKKCLLMLRLASLERRKANRHPCACGSGRRVGKCHHRKLNRLRQLCGRLALGSEYRRLTGGRAR